MNEIHGKSILVRVSARFEYRGSTVPPWLVHFSMNFIAYFECKILAIFTLKCRAVLEIFRKAP